MDLPIRNIGDLRSEIMRLKGVEQDQSVALKARFSSPSAIFGTIFSLFPKSAGPGGEKSAGLFDQDFVGLISRFVLPLALNKTLFRHSNFLVKALVGLVSQKASNYISEDAVVSVWDKIKSLFNKTKKGKDTPPRRGVPSFSETY
ncbi:hypothetical protein BH09BAC6_BH09BAC6_00760 [soil metagenome]|jgi:hypothetical protein